MRQVDVADCFRKFGDAIDTQEVMDRLHVTDPGAKKLTIILKSLCWYSENLAGVPLLKMAKGKALDLLNGDRG